MSNEKQGRYKMRFLIYDLRNHDSLLNFWHNFFFVFFPCFRLGRDNLFCHKKCPNLFSLQNKLIFFFYFHLFIMEQKNRYNIGPVKGFLKSSSTLGFFIQNSKRILLNTNSFYFCYFSYFIILKFIHFFSSFDNSSNNTATKVACLEMKYESRFSTSERENAIICFRTTHNGVKKFEFVLQIFTEV